MRRSGVLVPVLAALLAASTGWSVSARSQGLIDAPNGAASTATRPPTAPPSEAAPPKGARHKAKSANPAPASSERERDIAKASQPMRFTRVRAAASDCGTACAEWIAAEGRIMPGATSAQLRRTLAALGDRKLPILIHSAGGAVEEAYAIGRMIRAKGLSVSVTKTDYVDCAPGDAACKALQAKGIRLGTPKPPLSVCASSCVFVLAGGVQRHVGPLSLIGVHQYESSVTQVQVLQKYRMIPHPRTGELVKDVISEERVSQKTIKTKTRDEVYDKSEAYFREMGVAASIMTPLKATPHSAMHWLSPLEVTETRIATDRRVATQVLGLAPNLSTALPQPACAGSTHMCQTGGAAASPPKRDLQAR